MIKAHDKTKITEISESGEDYLEAIFLLYKKTGYVRSVDVAEYFGYSKPSISHAVSVLEDGVEQEQADREACRMEHTVSEDSFRKLKLNADRGNACDI